jgi:hypothetical protein
LKFGAEHVYSKIRGTRLLSFLFTFRLTSALTT